MPQLFAKKFSPNLRRIFLRVDADILLDSKIDFTINEKCFLAKALKRQFGDSIKVSVSVDDLDINRTKYNILGNNGGCRFLEAFRESATPISPDTFVVVVLEKEFAAKS